MHENSVKAIESSIEQEEQKIKKLLDDHKQGGSESIQQEKEAYRLLEEEVVELKKQCIDNDLSGKKLNQNLEMLALRDENL